MNISVDSGTVTINPFHPVAQWAWGWFGRPCWFRPQWLVALGATFDPQFQCTELADWCLDHTGYMTSYDFGWDNVGSGKFSVWGSRRANLSAARSGDIVQFRNVLNRRWLTPDPNRPGRPGYFEDRTWVASTPQGGPVKHHTAVVDAVGPGYLYLLEQNPRTVHRSCFHFDTPFSGDVAAYQPMLRWCEGRKRLAPKSAQPQPQKPQPSQVGTHHAAR